MMQGKILHGLRISIVTRKAFQKVTQETVAKTKQGQAVQEFVERFTSQGLAEKTEEIVARK